MKFRFLAVVNICLVFWIVGCYGNLVSINLESVRSLVPPQIPVSSNLVYKSYNSKIYCSASSKFVYPSTVKEIQILVKKALHSGKTVKAVGSRHSSTDIICTDGIPINLRNFNQTTVNNDGSATVGAGTRLSDMLQILHNHNRTIIQMPLYGGITIGGAIATGAHGSTLRQPSTLSDQVVRLRIIDGLGKIRVIDDPTELQALRVNLGLLGVIVDATIKTIPLVKLTIENSLQSESILLDGTAVNWAKEYDTFALSWFPSSMNVVVFRGNFTAVTTPGNAFNTFITDSDLFQNIARKESFEILQLTRNKPGLFILQDLSERSLYTNSVGTPFFTENGVIANPATGFAWQLLSANCQECHWDHGPYSINRHEVSISVDVDELPGIVNKIKNILEQSEAAFPIVGIRMRFSGASDALMATHFGRPTVMIEWVTTMRNNPYESPEDGIAAYQAMQQMIMKEHGGRPHWGKNGGALFTKEMLKTLPNREVFIQFMNKYDPRKVFMNKFGRRLLGREDFDMDPNVTHCALQYHCFCKQDSDCANLQNCQLLNGYPVCNDPSGSLMSLL